MYNKKLYKQNVKHIYWIEKDSSLRYKNKILLFPALTSITRQEREK